MKLDHIVLYVNSLKKATKFYTAFLGQPIHSSGDDVAWQIGEVKLFLAEKESSLPSFDKKNVGLNHLALGVQSIDELRVYEKKLNIANIKHSGIQIDKYGGKEFIWFDDPDGIRLEFYLRES